MQALTEEIIRLVMKQDPTITPDARDEILKTLHEVSRMVVAPSCVQQAPTSLRLYRIGQAAKVLGLSRCTVWRCIKDGSIGTVEIRAGTFRISEVELQRFVAGRA
jgi:excisionase family DNA binding protein